MNRTNSLHCAITEGWNVEGRGGVWQQEEGCGERRTGRKEVRRWRWMDRWSSLKGSHPQADSTLEIESGVKAGSAVGGRLMRGRTPVEGTRDWQA